MKKRTFTIATGLALLAGLLMVAGAAWAQAKKTPIEVEIPSCSSLGEPERDWVDEDGIRHIRDWKYRCRFSRDIVGREVGWESRDVDQATGEISWHGYDSFTGTVLGEPVTAVGRFTIECSRIEGLWLCTENVLWHLSDGSLVKYWGTWEIGANTRLYSGILLDPPGGESRQGPRRRR